MEKEILGAGMWFQAYPLLHSGGWIRGDDDSKFTTVWRRLLHIPDSILCCTHIILFAPNSITFVNKAMVFPIIMYGCESWTIKKAEC